MSGPSRGAWSVRKQLWKALHHSARFCATLFAIMSDGMSDLSDYARNRSADGDRFASPAAVEREALARAFEAGALAVHKEWLAAAENDDGPPRGDPEFSEAANDYAAAQPATAGEK